MDDSEYISFQNLLHFLIEKLENSKLKIHNGNCYKYVDDYWEIATSLNEFLYKTVRKDLNYEMWQNLTCSSNMVNNVIKYLENYNSVKIKAFK